MKNQRIPIISLLMLSASLGSIFFTQKSYCQSIAQGLVGTASAEKPIPPPIENELVSSEQYTILRGTPTDTNSAKPQTDCAPKRDNQAHVAFSLTRNGNKNIDLTKSSGIFSRDFLLFYSTLASPPLKVSSAFNGSLDCEVFGADNNGSAIRQPEEDRKRFAQALNARRKINVIHFAVIPISVRATHLQQFSLEELCGPSNIVGIAAPSYEKIPSRLIGLKTVVDPTQLDPKCELFRFYINQPRMASFLSEWPAFYKSHPAPSKVQIVNFANTLKMRYHDLLITNGR